MCVEVLDLEDHRFAGDTGTDDRNDVDRYCDHLGVSAGRTVSTAARAAGIVVRNIIRSQSEDVARWIAQINNEGRSAAQVEMFAVIAGERTSVQSLCSRQQSIGSRCCRRPASLMWNEWKANSIPRHRASSGRRAVFFDAHVRGDLELQIQGLVVLRKINCERYSV